MLSLASTCPKNIKQGFSMLYIATYFFLLKQSRQTHLLFGSFYPSKVCNHMSQLKYLLGKYLSMHNRQYLDPFWENRPFLCLWKEQNLKSIKISPSPFYGLTQESKLKWFMEHVRNAHEVCLFAGKLKKGLACQETTTTTWTIDRLIEFHGRLR